VERATTAKGALIFIVRASPCKGGCNNDTELIFFQRGRGKNEFVLQYEHRVLGNINYVGTGVAIRTTRKRGFEFSGTCDVSERNGTDTDSYRFKLRITTSLRDIPPLSGRHAGRDSLIVLRSYPKGRLTPAQGAKKH
jgi:hypothetical protein